MKTKLAALLAAAALSVPAMAQQQNPNEGQAQQQPMAQQQQQNSNEDSSMDKSANGGQAQQAQESAVKLTSSEIRDLQKALDSKGFKAGKEDGIFGPETQAALKKFQQQNGMQATGEPTRQSLTALMEGQGNGAHAKASEAKRSAKNTPGQPQNDQNAGKNQGQPQPDASK